MPEKQSSNNKSLRGVDVLNNPRRNRGTAFTQKEREDLGLVGLLPAGIETLDQQVDRVLGNLAQKPNDLEKYIYRATGIGVRAITEIHGWRIC
jgi:malate dehydrogenase (oxaloacetate-decarboxylating)(NADP+)